MFKESKSLASSISLKLGVIKRVILNSKKSSIEERLEIKKNQPFSAMFNHYIPLWRLVCFIRFGSVYSIHHTEHNMFWWSNDMSWRPPCSVMPFILSSMSWSLDPSLCHLCVQILPPRIAPQSCHAGLGWHRLQYFRFVLLAWNWSLQLSNNVKQHAGNNINASHRSTCCSRCCRCC